MYENVMLAVQSRPWAILPQKLDQIMAFLRAKNIGAAVARVDFQAVAADNRKRREPTKTGAVAVLPVLGTIAQRMDLMTEFSGGTSTEAIGRRLDELLADDAVGAIVLDVDSPGGLVSGVPELAEKLYGMRGKKPIYAVANGLMASAAYWIASAADKVYASPSAQVGSIGVLALHADWSKFNEDLGVKYNYVTYGANKAEFNSDEPLADDSRAELQRQVDTFGRMFDAAVAKHRGVTTAQVAEQFGQGRVYPAEEAVQRRLADGVATLDRVVGIAAGQVRLAEMRKKLT